MIHVLNNKPRNHALTLTNPTGPFLSLPSVVSVAVVRPSSGDRTTTFSPTSGFPLRCSPREIHLNHTRSIGRPCSCPPRQLSGGQKYSPPFRPPLHRIPCGPLRPQSFPRLFHASYLDVSLFHCALSHLSPARSIAQTHNGHPSMKCPSPSRSFHRDRHKRCATPTLSDQ